MRRLRLLAFASLAVLSACKPPDAALRVNVTVRALGVSRVRADCLKLSVSDGTQVLKSIVIPLTTGKEQYVFGVLRGSDLPKDVRLQASGFLGTCTDEASLKLNAQGEVVNAVFPEKGVTEFSVFLDPPGSQLDADRDGFVAASKGGIDCRDDDVAIFPGAGQLCANNDDTDCDGQGGCDDDECGTAAVCANPPDRVALTTSVTTMLRYECVGPFTVELRNANGPRTAVRNTPVSLTSSLGGVTVHGVATCNDTALTTQTIPYGQTSFEVYLKADAQAFGVATLTARADRVAAPGTASVTVRPQPVASLAFTSPPRTLAAGQCSAEPVTLEFRDAQNRRTDVDSPTQVTLSSSPGDVGNANIFFSDAACGDAAPVAMLQAGQGTVTAYVKARRAGSFTLTATPSIQQPTTQGLTVTAAAAAQLAFTNAPLVLNTTQSCSAGALTLQLQDEFANPVTATAPVPVRLGVTGLMNVSLYDGAQPNCMTAAATDFTIPAGRDSISLRASGTVASATPGQVTASVTNGAAITQAAQDLFVSAGFASRFVLQGSASSPLANVCSANPVTIELRDSANNPASSASDVVFTLSAPPLGMDPSFQFFTGAGCQQALTPAAAPTLRVPAGQTSAQFYFRGNKAQAAFEIRAASTLTAPAMGAVGNTIRPAAPGKLVTTGASTLTTQAGSCTATPFTAEVRDLYDNVTSFAAQQTVLVTPTPAGATVGPSGACTADSVTLAAGASQVSFTARATTAISYNLIASVGGFSNSPGVTLNVTPAPSRLEIDVPAKTPADPTVANVNATAGGCQQVTLTRRDEFGNIVPTSGAASLTLAPPTSTSWDFYTSNNCTTGLITASPATVAMNSTHTVTFSVRPKTAGVHALRATLGAQVATLNFTVTPGPTAQLAVLDLPSASVTAGACIGPLTVRRRDAFGNDVTAGAEVVALSSASNRYQFTTVASCSSGSAAQLDVNLDPGASTASFYARVTMSGTHQMTATLKNSTPVVSATGSVTIDAAAPSALVYTTPVRTFTAGACAGGANLITVQLRDVHDNVAIAPTGGVALTASSGSATGLWFTNNTCGTAASGGAFTIPAGSSSVSLYYRDNKAGPATVTLTNGASLTNPAAQAHTVVPAAASKLVFITPVRTYTAGVCGGAGGVITVQLQDAFDNPVNAGGSGQAFTASSTGTETWFTNDTCGATAVGGAFTIPAGSNSVSLYYRDTLAGTSTVTLSNGAGLSNPAGQGHTVNPAAASQLVFTTPARTYTAGVCGGAGGAITVQLQDAFGNPVSADGGGQAFTVSSNSTGTVGWFTDTGCATAAAGGAFTIPSGSNSVSLYYRDTKSGTPTVTLANGSGLTNPAGQVHTVNPAAASKLVFITPERTFTAGVCGGTGGVITVQLQDAFDNPVNAPTGGRAFTASSNSTGTVGWFTNNTCGTAAAGGNFTIPAGSSSVSLFYRDTKAGAATVSLTNGASLANPTAQVHTVNAAAASRLAFTTPVRTYTAGVCGGAAGAITVQLQDAFGNPVNAGGGGQAFTASSTGTASWFSDDTCATAAGGGAFSIPAGSNSVSLYYQDTKSGTSTVTLTNGSSLTNPAGQGHTVNAAAANRLAFTTPVRTFTAGACSGAANVITVQLQDVFGNPANASAGGLGITAASSAVSGSWYSDTGCATAIGGGNFTIPAGSSSVALYYRDNKAGPATVSLTNNGGFVDPTAQAHTVNPAAASKLVFTTPVRTYTVGVCGGAAGVITVQLQDAFDNPVNAGVAGQAFTASSTGTETWFTTDTCGAVATGGVFTIPSGSNSVSLYYQDLLAGTATVTLTNSSSLANPTGQAHTVNAGAPSRLGFTNGAVTVAALGCGGPLTIALQDVGGNTVPNTSDRVVTMSATPGGLNGAFFSNAGCTAALTNSQVTLANGSSTVQVYFSAENAGALTVDAASSGLTNAQQVQTVTAAAATKLAVTTAPATVEAGFCHPVVVERRDALDRATSPASATSVTVTSAAGVSFFSNAACTTALTTLNIAAGTSSGTFYAKGLSGSLTGVVPGSQLYTLTAAAGGLTSGTYELTVLPMVRRRSAACAIASGASSVTCAVTPTLTDVGRTILFFQAAAGGTLDAPEDDNVTCKLALNGSNEAEVVCQRAGTGAAAVNVEWQTLSFPQGSGVTVQHLSGGCAAGAGTMPMTAAVTNLANNNNRFVLFSTRTAGTANNADHFFTARLTSTSALTISQASNAATCAVAMNYEAQVVNWPNTTINRNVLTGGTAASFTANPTLSGQTFLLYSSRQVATDTSGTDICARRLRGALAATNPSVTFTRGCTATGADVQDIAWEAVRLPATGGTVQQVSPVEPSNNQASVTFTWPTAVDLTRTVLFMGGQGPGGSATGMTNQTNADRIGSSQALVVPTSSTGATLTRGAGDFVGTFTVFVMQVTP